LPISNEDSKKLMMNIRALNPDSLAVEFDNISNVTIRGDHSDMSGIDIKQAICEFIDMLEVSNKEEIKSYTLDVYDLYKG
jgi:hypothetical protein